RSPARSSATAVGLPQPSEAATASAGSASRSSVAYRVEPKFSSTSTGSGPQQAVLPSVTFTAAAAYRRRTVSRRSVVVCSLMTSLLDDGHGGARNGLH